MYVAGFGDCYEPLLRKRRSDAERKAQDRAGKRVASSKRRRADVRPTSSGHPSDVRAPSERHRNAPDLTGPDRTGYSPQPSPGGEGGGASAPPSCEPTAPDEPSPGTVDRPAQNVPSALQIAPDSKRTLVSKDVGGERWAITKNADDGTVSGNVFTSDGAEPKFVWCEPIGNDGNPDPSAVLVTYACSGADRCNASPCTADQWSFLSEVTLPGSFFLP